MLEVNWAPLVGATVITSKAWNSIPPATQQVLRKAAEEAGVQMRASGRLEAEKSVKTMTERGLKVQKVTPEVEAEWRSLAESVYPKIRGNMVPAAMFDKVQRLLAEYRAGKGKTAK
jgi:TRAP-type C4-dicarboxylate transport system substrate-binding protein